jgi:hypothetical protein
MPRALGALGREASAPAVIDHVESDQGAIIASHESAQLAATISAGIERRGAIEQIDLREDSRADLTALEMMRPSQVIVRTDSAAIDQRRIGVIVKGDDHLGREMRGQLDSVVAASHASSVMVIHALDADRPVRTESVARARLTAIVLAESDQRDHSAATEIIAVSVPAQVRDLDEMTGLGSLGLAVLLRATAGQVIDQRAPTAPLGVSAT